MQLHFRRLADLVHRERDDGDLRPLHVRERAAMLRLLQLLDHRTIGMDPIGSLHHPLLHRRGEDHADRLRRPVPLRRERIVDNHVHYLNVPPTMPPAG